MPRPRCTCCGAASPTPSSRPTSASFGALPATAPTSSSPGSPARTSAAWAARSESTVREAVSSARCCDCCERGDVPWLVLENVPFLMSLGQGAALTPDHDGADRAGLPVGVPRRRHQRVRPAAAAQPVVPGRQPRRRPARRAAGRRRRQARSPPATYPDVACGFYWTEGMRAFGWAVDGVPPIKCGSSVGVASPPAIRLPSGALRHAGSAGCRTAARLSGRLDGARRGGRQARRTLADGRQLGQRAGRDVDRRAARDARPLSALDDRPWTGAKWPRRAAWADLDGVVHAADVGPWPRVACRGEPLADFLASPGRAAVGAGRDGFPAPHGKGTLRFPAGLHRRVAGLRAKLIEPATDRTSPESAEQTCAPKLFASQAYTPSKRVTGICTLVAPAW